MMIRFLAAYLLWCALLAPAHATWSLVQHPINTGCGTANTCTLTLTQNTGSGNVLIVLIGTGGNVTISSITGGAGTFSHCAASAQSNGTNNVDAQYTASSTSGVGSIAVNISGTVAWDYVALEEYSSTTTFAFDNCAGTTYTGVTNPVGPTITISGSNDVLVNSNVISSSSTNVSAPFTNPAVFAAAANGDCIGGAINQSAGTGMTCTAASSNGVAQGVAFKETSAGATCPMTRSLMGVGC